MMRLRLRLAFFFPLYYYFLCVSCLWCRYRQAETSSAPKLLALNRYRVKDEITLPVLGCKICYLRNWKVLLSQNAPAKMSEVQLLSTHLPSCGVEGEPFSSQNAIPSSEEEAITLTDDCMHHVLSSRTALHGWISVGADGC